MRFRLFYVIFLSGMQLNITASFAADPAVVDTWIENHWKNENVKPAEISDQIDNLTKAYDNQKPDFTIQDLVHSVWDSV